MTIRKIIMIALLLLLVMLPCPIFIIAGDLEPSSSPGSTMMTLEDVYTQSQVILDKVEAALACGDAPVPKTGQLTIFADHDDADENKGVPLPETRFTNNGDGTVTDNLTNLVWLRNANYFGQLTWEDAIQACHDLAAGGDLTDGSAQGNWRMPNLNELKSLRNFQHSNPCISDNPFYNIENYLYWSSSTYMSDETYAWIVSMDEGTIYGRIKDSTATEQGPFLWPVRDPF